MKKCLATSVLALVLLWSAAVVAQDPVKVAPANYKVVLENAAVRVIRVDYPAGAKSAMHQHPDSLVIPLAPSKVRFTTPDGKSEDADMPSESAMFVPAATHSSANVGTARVDAVLIEFKTAAPGTAAIPTDRANMAMKVLAEGPRATAYRSTAAPAFVEPAGSTHAYDQIVIALGAAPMSLAINGKPAKTTWARGDVQFIGRGVPHESKNTGSKPVDFVIVAVK